MKKRGNVLRLIILIAVVVISCSPQKEPRVNGEPLSEYSFRAEIIKAEESLLIMPDEESNEYLSSDRMTVNISEAELVNADGQLINSSELAFGDIVIIRYNGTIAESYPAQISAFKVEIVDHDYLTNGVLKLIDDIYQEDEGLNGEIEMIALDTSGWASITSSQKQLILEKVTESYGYEVVEGTYEELSEQGLIDKEKLYFPKGILIKLSNLEYNASKGKLTCSISKWRSGLGAIGSDDVTASFQDGEWKITKKGMWIS